ncbi:DUF397 domain-containing protein [Nocardiopsis synnemataformans]|uniref:DUF397 domain-containing protein n=1 Tax=Nocardiopsis synnemataformans TaxID=61305 RepID=UPI003EC11A49
MYSSLEFRKSSYSANEAACVEVADAPGVSVIRDTQNRDAGILAFPAAEWRALINTARQEA